MSIRGVTPGGWMYTNNCMGFGGYCLPRDELPEWLDRHSAPFPQLMKSMQQCLWQEFEQ